MSKDFRFLMIGAMYENGGNTTHRFLDGHPQMFVYPFESQPGTALVNDRMSSLFPLKYRWPTFALHATPQQDYRAIIDEECKVRARTPFVSKFRDWEFKFDDEERMAIYCEYVGQTGRSRGNNMAAFFRATFDAWKSFNRSGREEVYVGYSPIITVDADKILNDLPQAHFLHVVRNPWAAYADTKKRPVPLSLEDYILNWNINQYHALIFKQKFGNRFHLLRIEDTFDDPRQNLSSVCEKMGLEVTDTLSSVTWNGRKMDEVYPWGTIRKATPEANLATANELSAAEKAEIRERTFQYLETFDYKGFLG